MAVIDPDTLEMTVTSVDAIGHDAHRVAVAGDVVYVASSNEVTSIVDGDVRATVSPGETQYLGPMDGVFGVQLPNRQFTVLRANDPMVADHRQISIDPSSPAPSGVGIASEIDGEAWAETGRNYDLRRVELLAGPATTSLSEAMADQPTTTSVLPVWSGPVRDGSALVHGMAADEGGLSTLQDPLDAAVGWADVERVAFSPEDQAHWYIELAAKPPLAADRESGLLIASGLVLETTGDEVADYLVGIDNDAPEPGDFHVWVTDLATGETDEQIGPPYGLPVEFVHPDEQQPGDPPGPPTVLFTFLGPSTPADLDPETVRFYAWTSATRDGEVVAWDYAPDTGWSASMCPEGPGDRWTSVEPREPLRCDSGMSRLGR